MADDYRSEFAVTQNLVFLNHAAVAPISNRARAKMVAYADDMAAFGNLHEAQWWGEVEEVRTNAARLLHANRSEIAFVKNTSEGISFIAEGFPWKVGDNVVIAAGEYPANVYPWMHLASRGVEVKTVPCRGVRVSIDDLAAAIDARTRLLSLSFVQFSTGYRSDLAAVGKLCKERGIDFCVDAIQGLGVFDIDVQRDQIDYLAADGHKWLVGPEGAGVFFIAADKLDKIRVSSMGWKSVVGWTDFSTIDYRLRPDAARFENGTFNVCGILGMGASIELFAQVGQPEIERRIRAITDELVDRLPEIGAQLVSSRQGNEWSGIVSFILPDRDPLSVVRHCKRHGVVISTRAGRLRASPHFYNNSADLDRLIEAIRSFPGPDSLELA